MMVTMLTSVVEEEHWSKGKGKEDPYVCLLTVNNRRCHYGLFKQKFHMNYHMKDQHEMTMGKDKPDPKSSEQPKSKKRKIAATPKNPNF